jgi:8-oxo-dGTP pyrophosphatase MutT (NUDIX family)
MPDLTASLEQRLRDRGDWLGASCVPRWGEAGFLFAGRVGRDVLTLSGIGGKVEPGESFEAAMLREFTEETGCRLGAPCRVDSPRHLTELARAEPVPDDAAALIAEHADAHPADGILWIAVFLAVLNEQPRPVEKIKTFVVLPRGALSRALDRLEMADLAVAADGAAVPARQVLPPGVTRLSAEHTAAAVLRTPGLLEQWWAATSGRG